MKKILFVAALLLMPSSAQAADYNVYVRPHGYYIPQVNPNIQPFWDYQKQMNGLLQAQPQMMQQQMLQQQAMNQQMMILQMEQQRQSIMAWQKYLTEKGYDPGPIDGVHNPHLEQAYLRYLADQKQLNEQQQAQQRQNILGWQKLLVEQGYDIGSIDGTWGPRSQRAYQDYMTKQNGQTNR